MPATKASWTAVLTVAVGAFALVTAEFLPVGLLPRIVADIGVTEGQAGLMVTIPGLVAAVTAPTTLALAGRLDRRLVLCVLMGLLLASSVIVAAASAFPALLVGRVLLGVGVGAFWTIGGPIGPRLRPEGARATSIIYSGISAGTVAGLPAGALLGTYLDWRSAFIATAVLAAVVAAALLAFLPPVPAQPGSGIRSVPAVLRLRTVRIGLIAVVLGFGGHFAAYTYIAPTLATAAQIDGPALSAVLLVFGVAGFIGNIVAGWATQRALRTTVITTNGLLGVSIVALVLAGSNPIIAIAAVTAWGLAFGMVPIAMQTLLFSADPDRLESIAAVFVCVAQTSIGSGALFGGLLVDHFGLSAALLTGAAGALLSAATIHTSIRSPSERKVVS